MEGSEWKKLCKWSEWDSTRNSSSQQSIILSPPSPALSSPTILVEYFKQCSTLVWTSVTIAAHTEKLWRKTHKKQSCVEVSTPPWLVRWWWWCLDGGQLTSWWRLMGRDRKTIDGNPSLVPALPHSTPGQNRFQTSFPLSRLGTRGLLCTYRGNFSFSAHARRNPSCSLISDARNTSPQPPTLGRHLPTPEIVCIYEFVKFNPELWAAWDHTAVLDNAAGAGVWAEDAGLRSVLVGSILKLSHRHNTFLLVACLWLSFHRNLSQL